MRRLFLAVPLPRQIKKRLALEVEELRKLLPDWTIKWVDPENLHITLVFFGWVKEEQIETLQAEIRTAVPESLPFDIATGKLSRKGRPLWLEIESGRNELQALAETLSKKLTLKGSLKEEREFHPHLTLGRIKKRGRKNLPKTDQSFGWRADRLVLYESKFVRKQRIYEEVFSFPLGE
uniref:RNA 2',3'-cyclic phosphodiesterase n=1 Tax=candidate division WWE3 bacterium TaxID=2053526 RepID=A0A831Z2N4_UNCKA